MINALAARHIMLQVVDAVLYLHSHGIIHRDLTLGNLLLTKNRDVVCIVSCYLQFNPLSPKHGIKISLSPNSPKLCLQGFQWKFSRGVPGTSVGLVSLFWNTKGT